MEEIKIEKRITEKDVRDAIMKDINPLTGNAMEIVSLWQLQELKDQQAKDCEFDIIQPKQISQ